MTHSPPNGPATASPPDLVTQIMTGIGQKLDLLQSNLQGNLATMRAELQGDITALDARLNTRLDNTIRDLTYRLDSHDRDVNAIYTQLNHAHGEPRARATSHQGASTSGRPRTPSPPHGRMDHSKNVCVFGVPFSADTATQAANLDRLKHQLSTSLATSPAVVVRMDLVGLPTNSRLDGALTHGVKVVFTTAACVARLLPLRHTFYREHQLTVIEDLPPALIPLRRERVPLLRALRNSRTHCYQMRQSDIYEAPAEFSPLGALLSKGAFVKITDYAALQARAQALDGAMDADLVVPGDGDTPAAA